LIEVGVAEYGVEVEILVDGFARIEAEDKKERIVRIMREIFGDIFGGLCLGMIWIWVWAFFRCVALIHKVERI
jgi:hypothetical protein